MNHPKKNSQLWHPGTDDLPSDAVVGAEPRLRALEHNPVFRLFVHHRRIQTFADWPVVAARLLLLAGVAAILTGDRADPMAAMGLGVFFAFYGISFSGSPLRSGGILPRSLHRVRVYLSDLALAGVSPEAYASAIWGWASSRRRLVALRRNALLDVAIFSTGVLCLASEPWALLRWILFLGLFWCASDLGALRAAPYPMLSQALRSTAPLRTMNDGEINSLDLVWGMTNALVLMLVNGLMVVSWWAGIWLLAGAEPAAFGLLILSLLCCAFCIGCGILWGGIRGIYMRRCARHYFDVLAHSIDQSIRNWLQVAEGEKETIERRARTA